MGSIDLEPSAALVMTPDSASEVGSPGTLTASSRRLLPAPLSLCSAAVSTTPGRTIEARLNEPPPLAVRVAEASSVQPVRVAVPETVTAPWINMRVSASDPRSSTEISPTPLHAAKQKTNYLSRILGKGSVGFRRTMLAAAPTDRQSLTPFGSASQ